MKIAPLQITDPWVHRLARNRQANAQTLSAVPCDIAVRMEAVSVLHHGTEQNYRPYLHLRGRLIQVHPGIDLPYGITELPFRSGAEPSIDAFYEFDTDQLTELVRKGYFGPRFRVPDTMTGIVWELPAEADFLLVAPEDFDQPPLVFVGVRDQSSAVLTEENSGYTLSAYFPDYSDENSEQLAAESQPSVPTRSGQIHDLFADDEFEDLPHGQTGSAHRGAALGQGPTEQIPKGVFDRLLEEVEAQRHAEDDAAKPGEDFVHDSPEGLLREITPGVEEALSAPAEAGFANALERRTKHVGKKPGTDGFLDLDSEDEEKADGPSVFPGDSGPTSPFEGSADQHTRRHREEDDYWPAP